MKVGIIQYAKDEGGKTRERSSMFACTIQVLLHFVFFAIKEGLQVLRVIHWFTMNSLLASLLLLTWASADHTNVHPEAPLLTPTGCTSLHCHILSHLPEVVGCCVVPEDRSK